MDQKTKNRTLVRLLLRWYRQNGRDLPWRRTTNPYRILVSEVMLQQTQVSRVQTKYGEFLRKFPNVQSLAKANRAEVIRAWQGMGYNNRALRLHELAKRITRGNRVTFPRTTDELEQLPGVGKYTAHAIACFAFRESVPVVDTNVRRILNRLFPLESKKMNSWEIAENVLPRKQAYDWNQALMDFGATICTAANPECNRCPLVSLCPSAFRIRRVARKKSREPERDGVPNRIYRGRIVEALRQVNGRGTVSAETIARLIKQEFRARDERWFRSLLDGLERDGLIALRNQGKKLLLSLPRS